MPKIISTLSPVLNRRLVAYALSAAAGAVGLACHAEAQVIYTQTDLTIGPGIAFIDFDGDGTSDFILKNRLFSTGYIRQASLSVGAYRSKSAAVMGLPHAGLGQRPQAFAVPKGVPIGSDSPAQFISIRTNHVASMAFARRNNYSAYIGGHWANVSDAYLGLKFTLQDGVHYGWARLTVVSRTRPEETTIGKLTGYAYEATPNKTIIAGDRGLGSSPANSGSLGALAFGAAMANSGHN
jgi:hypothetical protein